MDVAQPSEFINQLKDQLGERCQKLFQEFLEEFKQGGDVKYLADTCELVRPERNTLVVSFADVEQFNGNLANTILQKYYRIYPYLCLAVKNFAHDRGEVEAKKDFYISFVDVPSTLKVRDVRTGQLGSLVRITGQVVRTHPVHPELVSATFVCTECQTIIKDIQQQFKYTQPTICRNPACNNRKKFILDITKSKFVDFQKVRIQETQDELPRGCIPRSIEVVLRAEAVETAQAGDRCDFTGTLIVVPDVSVMSFPGIKAESGSRHQGDQSEGLRGLKALGVRDLTYRLAFLACTVTPSFKKYGGLNPNKEEMTPELLRKQMSISEWDKVYSMSQDHDLYKNLCNSLFPTIYGNDEVKKGILLMLFGGVPKSTTEETRLRGDINVCVVGDPSTAKSQLLKMVESFSPRAVYTSGKASTAAGLTAAVVKDEESHEFVIEAGALMLSDNGVCCIDEFDKMDPRDQVAIHEAMEQQTISITKAGIRATLNARTSILAAANPVGGKYDKARSLRQNVSMTAPIMSRFDLFFVLVDECNEIADYDIASRIVTLHRKLEDKIKRTYQLEDVQKYITFARLFKPRIARTSVDRIVSYYKEMRLKDQGSSGISSWRVTVRQLESMIRLSEALARMRFQNEVQPGHVDEAFRLLSKSIVRVEQPDICLDEDVNQGANVLGNAMDVDEPSRADNRQQDAGQKLTYEQYTHLANLLILHLKKQEDECVRMSSLVNWYLQEMEIEIDSEEELIARKSLVEKVINRLINNDHIIIKLTQTLQEEGSAVVEEDPLLVLYPNYVL